MSEHLKRALRNVARSERAYLEVHLHPGYFRVMTSGTHAILLDTCSQPAFHTFLDDLVETLDEIELEERGLA